MRLPLAAALALLIGACTPSAPAPSPATAPAATELRVMSFNIRYGTARDGDDSWPFRRDLVVRVIRDFDPAALGVQEALRGQLDELDSALPEYAEIGVGRDDGRTAGEYAALLYREDRLEALESGTFWFSDTPDVPGSMSWGNRITRIATWARLRDRLTSDTVLVCNLHLDHESQPSRERSAVLLAEWLERHRAGHRLIVLGDFNSGEANPAYRFLVGAAEAPSGSHPSPRLRDAFRAVHPDADVVGTFHAFRGDSTGEKIDHILIAGDWTVLDAGIVRTSARGRFPSDHFPVTAVLGRAP
ncbi:MAG TPA: endonuclease/exonuclease/phosphatase family protein [Gemmatimonadales bacterium]|nr:endonuclease/exonuclease/phosphatase family protein [Gemmatimonadales bacterium]